MPIREGVVTEVTLPSAGKKMASAKVGNRKVWFFPTAYQSSDPSQLMVELQAAAQSGSVVVVEGDEREGQGASGPYTSFTAKQVLETKGVAIGSNGHSSNGSHAPSNRDQELITAQWAIGRAVEAWCSGKIEKAQVVQTAADLCEALPKVKKALSKALAPPPPPEPQPSAPSDGWSEPSVPF